MIKEKMKNLNKKIIAVFAASLFVSVFAINVSYAASFDPNYSYTSPSGTTYSGLIPALMNYFSQPSDSGTPSPGFVGPSGFNTNGFTGQGNSGVNSSLNTPYKLPDIGLGGSGSLSCQPGQARNFRELIVNLFIGCILSPLVYLIIAASIIVFLWGVFKFIRSEGDDKQAGREFIIWGIVGLFVMVSIWGLVSILSNTFNLNNASINVPSLTN